MSWSFYFIWWNKRQEDKGKEQRPKKVRHYFQIQSGCVCTEEVLVKHSPARATWKKYFVFLDGLDQQRPGHRSGLTLQELVPFPQGCKHSSFRGWSCSSRQTPPAAPVLASGGGEKCDGLVPVTFPTKENAYFHINSKGCSFFFVFRLCTKPSGTFSSHKCLFFLIKDFLVRNEVASTPALPTLSALSFWLRAEIWGDKNPSPCQGCSHLAVGHKIQEETVPGPLHFFFSSKGRQHNSFSLLTTDLPFNLC